MKCITCWKGLFPSLHGKGSLDPYFKFRLLHGRVFYDSRLILSA